MYYIQTFSDGRIMAVHEITDDLIEKIESVPEVSDFYKGMLKIELPEDFDWEHIDRYSVDESQNLIDNGYTPPEEPVPPVPLETRVGVLEKTLSEMETAYSEGVNEA